MRLLVTLVPVFFALCSLGRCEEDLVPYVNPFLGTKPGAPGYIINNSNGNVFPGAVLPFGLVQFSPDTPNGNAGGYNHDSHGIKGFSLTHFSGRGIPCWMDIPVMPTLGQQSKHRRKAADFSHANEVASPGDYRVTFDNGIRTELTATARTGFALFTFPGSNEAVLQVDTQGDASSAQGGVLQVVDQDTVLGETKGQGCGGKGIAYKLYFYAKLDPPMTRHELWDKGRGVDLFLDAPSNAQVKMKVGLSFVDVEGAKKNLEAENPGWDLEAIRQKAVTAWEKRLAKVRVTGGTRDERTVFYTGLYHASIHPNLFSDSDGRALGFDQKIHQVPKGRARYHNFAAWDNYRTLMPLLSVLAPQETSDMMQSLVDMAEEDLAVHPKGGGLPRWQQANANSGGMEGDDQDAVIASAWALGARDFDAKKALAAMERGASFPGTTSGGALVRPGLEDWLSKGNVPHRGSLNLGYANDDFCIAQFARALGEEGKYRTYLQRSGNWRVLFDPRRDGEGYFVPRPWGEGLTLAFSLSCGLICGFEEGCSRQYTWMDPFSYPELFELMGGREKVIRRLDGHFYDEKGKPRLNEGPNSRFAFLGNEPGSAAPYAYHYAGAPERTAQLLREAVSLLFRNSPDGMPGNDDGGAMGSWLAWAMMGLRPVVSGTEQVVLTGPMFDSVTVSLASGKTLRIKAVGKTGRSGVLDRITLNGVEVKGHQVLWSDLSSGGELGFFYRPGDAEGAAAGGGERSFRDR